ncbi:hypothetical protein F6V25_10980 [Oryzomonas japonica]|uniref:NHL repeat containing protein n=1 Tax=Oryzomonas japonica TaxID=2603858 RepID=A0A7J4ZQ41_9BACT|nr:hypothetical protein [Oryzomonas japonica]KAB0665138.1 hypothetical protein F6V25_10980 [Oryzomonas japonica]
MQKSLWLTAALLLSLFISGCGGSTSASTIASTTDAFTAKDVYPNTFYVTSPKGAPYTTFHTYSGVTRYDWNYNPSDTATRVGTWALSATGSTVTFNVDSSTPAKTITAIQKVHTDATNSTVDYWLVYDVASKQNCRMYLDSPKTTFGAYTSSNAVRYGLMGGAIQKNTLPTAFSNVSTVVGITAVGDREKSTPTFSDYTAARTPPVNMGLPIGITTIDGKTFFVLDNYSNRVHIVTLDANGAATSVKTLRTAAATPVDIVFNNPADITCDGKNLYVTDTSNYTIDKIALSVDASGTYVGTFSILAGSTGAAGAIDGTGNTTTTTTTNGTITTSTATGAARFSAPVGITTDGTNLYVVDNQTVRKITLVPDGGTPQVTTLAGSLGATGSTDSTDGKGTSARFNLPLRITTDGTNLYVTDYYNYTIRKVSIATGLVTRIAGTSGTYGTNSTVSVASGDLTLFNGPNGITTDGTYLYVTDWGRVINGNPARGQVVFRIALTSSGFSGAVTRIAGTQDKVGSNTGTVSTADAYFCAPMGITMDGTSLYVADSQNYTIRRIK